MNARIAFNALYEELVELDKRVDSIKDANQ
jgi:hypothetical protein